MNLERSNESDDGSIRSEARVSRPAAWARFAVQVFIGITILLTSFALVIYDIVSHGKPTEITTVMLPNVGFIVGLFFNTKYAKDKKSSPQPNIADHDVA